MNSLMMKAQQIIRLFALTTIKIQFHSCFEKLLFLSSQMIKEQPLGYGSIRYCIFSYEIQIFIALIAWEPYPVSPIHSDKFK